jgi:uncharacterized protein
MKLAERYATVDALPRTIPVFPLNGVLMLPRANLPLNIFEPRYIQMFDDALSGTRLVGFAQPARQLSAEQESPQGKAVPLRATGGIGRITAFQEVDDGRLIVQLTGVCRFSLVMENETSRLYRTVTVDYTPFARDLLPGEGAGDVDREALLAALKRFLESRNMKADWPSIQRSENEQLVNALSVMSPYGPEEKQALLEAQDLKTRADLLIALAEMEIAAGERGGGSGTMLQ